MANFKLNSVTVATESSGTVTLDSAIAGIPAAGITGVLPVGVTGGSGLDAVSAGRTIQMVQTVKQDAFSTAGTSEVLVTGYNCSITPTKAGSKIFVQWCFDTGTSTSLTAYAYMERKIGSASWAKLTGAMGTSSGSSNTSAISHGGGENSWEMQKRSGMYLDTPSYTLTDAVQYRIGVRNENASATIYVGTTNRNNTIYHPVTASMLILSEIST